MRAALHGIQKVGILGGFHGDLGKEDHVIGKLGQARHEFEPLRPQGFELSHSGGVLLQPGQVQVGESDRVEIVISQGDKAKSQAAQLDHFFHDHIRGPLPGTLPIGAPDRAERAMLGASAHGLHRRPHITTARNQFPAGGHETAGLDLASVVDRLRSAFFAVGQRHRPGHVAIPSTTEWAPPNSRASSG